MLAPHRKYKSALEKVVTAVDNALQKVYPNKKLWKITELDSCRLTRLLVWRERYGVSLEYILEVLLSHYYSGLPGLRRSGAVSSRSLGIRIGTLTGDNSLAVIRDHLEQDFPDGNNIQAAKEEAKERIAELLDDELPKKHKGVLQFATLDRFVHAYTRYAEIRREGTLRVANKMRKLHWRNNPWL
jgi:hypothetical protein